MDVAGEPHDDVLLPALERAAARLPAGTGWLDVHTHLGEHDPDGQRQALPELLAGLDRAGVGRALVFAMHEPGGYPAANDAVRDAVAAADGRLAWLCRVAPGVPGALDEARRCLDAGASGIKLHPRADAFAADHPVVADLGRLAGERGATVLLHAGRGIPALGEGVVALARDNPGARVVLAHAGISDLGTVAPVAGELSNLLFDTSWWQVSDVLALLTLVPPGRILFASDLPYGSARFAQLVLLRCAAQVGLAAEVVAEIAGAQAERILGGEAPLDLGSPADAAALGPRSVAHERVVAFATAAAHAAYRGSDATEELLALARLGALEAPALEEADALLARAQEAWDAGAGRHAVWYPTAAALTIAGTPDA